MLHRDRDPDKPHSLFMSLTVKPLFDDSASSLDTQGCGCYTKPMNTAMKDAREQKGLTQEKLAELVGCTVNSIYNWEVKGVKPLPPYLAKLEEVLGVDLKEEQNEDRKESPAPR